MQRPIIAVRILKFERGLSRHAIIWYRGGIGKVDFALLYRELLRVFSYHYLIIGLCFRILYAKLLIDSSCYYYSSLFSSW